MKHIYRSLKLALTLGVSVVSIGLFTSVGFAQTATLPANSVQISTTTSITTFTAGAPALASEMNGNFNEIVTKYNDLAAKFNQLLNFVAEQHGGSPPQNPTMPTPVVHYPFDGNLTNVINNMDATSHKNDGDGDSNTNTVFVAGQVGSNGVSLEDDFLTLVNANNEWNLSNKDYSISFWAKKLDTVTIPQQMAFLFLSVNGNHTILPDDNGRPMWQVMNNGISGNLEEDSPFAGNTDWHHFVLIEENGTRTWYIDGVLQTPDSNVSAPSATSGGVFVGSRANGGLLPATTHQAFMDDLRLYHDALTGAQVLNLFNGTTP